MKNILDDNRLIICLVFCVLTWVLACAGCTSDSQNKRPIISITELRRILYLPDSTQAGLYYASRGFIVDSNSKISEATLQIHSFYNYLKKTQIIKSLDNAVRRDKNNAVYLYNSSFMLLIGKNYTGSFYGVLPLYCIILMNDSGCIIYWSQALEDTIVHKTIGSYSLMRQIDSAKSINMQPKQINLGNEYVILAWMKPGFRHVLYANCSQIRDPAKSWPPVKQEGQTEAEFQTWLNENKPLFALESLIQNILRASDSTFPWWAKRDNEGNIIK